MEMASGCPRPAPAVQTAPQSVRKPVRGPHGGWQKREIDALRERIAQAEKSGESLRSVFDEMGELLGRKPNSIRNFYYAQLREAQEGEKGRPLPFETFTQQEIEHLIRNILTARAQGMSVRACVRQLSGGDRSRMLRYQNKYRSVVRTRPELVKSIMARLSEEGTAFVSPYPGDAAESAGAQIAQLKSRAQSLSDAKLSQLLDSLTYLIELVSARSEPALEPVPPQESAALRRADKLRAQVDVLRIALDDERRRFAGLRTQAEDMVCIVKEYIAMPQADRESRLPLFCQQAAARLSAVECALMEDSPV